MRTGGPPAAMATDSKSTMRTMRRTAEGHGESCRQRSGWALTRPSWHALPGAQTRCPSVPDRSSSICPCGRPPAMACACTPWLQSHTLLGLGARGWHRAGDPRDTRCLSSKAWADALGCPLGAFATPAYGARTTQVRGTTHTLSLPLPPNSSWHATLHGPHPPVPRFAAAQQQLDAASSVAHPSLAHALTRHLSC